LPNCRHAECSAKGNYVDPNGLCAAHDPERQRPAALVGVAACMKVLPESTKRPNVRTLASVPDCAETNALLVATDKPHVTVSSQMRSRAATTTAAMEVAGLQRLATLEKAIRGRRLG
jgi:hypothetical protein